MKKEVNGFYKNTQYPTTIHYLVKHIIMMQSNKAFSLLELTVVLSIISILVLIAMPCYQHYLRMAHRTSAQVALLDLSGRLMQHYQQHHAYNKYAERLVREVDAAQHLCEPYYRIRIQYLDAHHYTLQAVPKGRQMADKQCGVLSLTNRGVRLANGGVNMECWP